jgi:hypothetical protein
MLSGVRARLTRANVMATGAMFLALGGGAYALSGIPDGSGVYHGRRSSLPGRPRRPCALATRARGRYGPVKPPA